MAVRDLENPKQFVHIINATDDVYDYLEMLVRSAHGVRPTSIEEVKNKADISSMISMLSLEPAGGGKWLFRVSNRVRIDQLKKVFSSPDLRMENPVIIRTKGYKGYLDAVSAIPGANTVSANFFSKEEAGWLLRKWSVSDTVKSQVVNAYRSDADKCIKLARLIDNGVHPKSKAEVVKLVGLAVGSDTFLLMDLLTGKSTKSLVQEFIEYDKSLGTQVLQRRLVDALKHVIDLKILYMTGRVYTRLTSSLPEGYDATKLAKYEWLLKSKLHDIPYERMIALSNQLTAVKWTTTMDAIESVYKWNSELCK